MSVIKSIGRANPAKRMTQPEVLEVVKTLLDVPEEDINKLKRVYSRARIDERYTVLEDLFQGKDLQEAKFPGIGARMEVYKNKLPEIVFAAIDDALIKADIPKESISHVITCSSTGFYSPGIDIEIIDHYKLPRNTGRTCINNMGCCGAINALKVAHAIAAQNPHGNVLVVCAELCSLHLKNSSGWKDLIVTSLFGDGAAAVILSGNATEKGLQIKEFNTIIHPDNGKDVSWYLKDEGFDVNLSSYVPDLVQKGIKNLVEDLFSKPTLKKEEIKFYAIHPGGRKIVEECEKELKLSPNESSYSYNVLKKFGNMSSPTVLFVLHDIMEEAVKHKGAKVLSLAFGPGVALESVLMEAA